MRYIFIAAVALQLTHPSLALAQRQDPWAQLQEQTRRQQQQMQAQQERTQAANVATKAEPLPNSLEQLLTAGWTIISHSMGPVGTQFVLRDNSRGWVLCDLQVVDGLGSLTDRPFSRCLKLN